MLHKSGLNLFLAIILLGLSVVAANAANAIVNVTGDPTGTGNCALGGSCSLRQAVNTVSPNDLIFFDIPAANCPDGVCTISLRSGLIISKNLTVLGPGARNLIIKPSTAPNTPEFTVITVGSISVRIVGVAISGGINSQQDGVGGVKLQQDGTLSLDYSSVTDCQGYYVGGISNAGGTLLLNNSLVGNNTGFANGGITNFGTLKLINSTVSNNLATDSVFFAYVVGGILNGTAPTEQGAFTSINSTISNNATLNQFPLTVGGLAGVYSSSTDIRNTIIAGNTTKSFTQDASGDFTSRGNNLIGNTTGSTGFNMPTDIVNQAPRFGPLTNNGGPTDTMALLSGSPAIDAGNDCVLDLSCTGTNPTIPLAFDQRAQPFIRKSGARVDIGAYEFQKVTAFDFDGDGKSDLSVFRSTDQNWYYNGSSNEQLNTIHFGFSSDKLVPADYDGDGKTDIAVWREGADGIFYVLQSSTNTVEKQLFGITGDDPRAVGDWDGDGKADVAVYRSGAQSTFYYRGSKNNPNGNITFVPWGITGDKPVRGDFDGDGKMDAAVFRPSNNVWYIRNSSNGTVRFDNWGIASDKFVPADYDGDSKTDLAVFRNGVWYIKQSADGQPRYESFGLASDQLTPADYDGDGKADIAIFRDGLWYINQSVSPNVAYNNFGVNSDTAIPSVFTN